MSALQGGPVFDPVIEGADGKMRQSWILFCQQLAQGDVGTSFTPVATNMGSTGTPLYSGVYFDNSGWTEVFIFVNPNGGDTTSTAGSTYFDLPYSIALSAPASVTSGVSSNYTGAVDAGTKRLYPPSWTNQANILTLYARSKS